MADRKYVDFTPKWMRGKDPDAVVDNFVGNCNATDDPALSDDTIPLRDEICASCLEPIVNHATAVQVRLAGEESSWCCSWVCVAKVAEREMA